MNPFHKLMLTLFALALFAGNAMAQCTGKKVYIKLPTGWPTNVIYVKSDNVQSLALTPTGNGWYEFTFSGHANYGNGKNVRFHMSNGEDGQIRRITPTAWDQAQDNGQWACNTWPDVSYIYGSAGGTVRSPDNPDAYYLYFLAPGDDEWTLGAPYFAWFDGGLKTKKLEYDDSRCGWFKMSWFNEPVPGGRGWIFLNEKGDDRIGLRGFNEEREEWVYELPAAFNLDSIFKAEYSGNPGGLFLIPTPEGNLPIWRKTDAGKKGVCDYKFAAIIYHTNRDKNKSFSRYGSDGKAEGLCKGFAAQRLDTTLGGTNGKIQWGGNHSCATDWTAANFKKAFEHTPGTNVMRCYDMPFERRSGGKWEFDAGFLCGNGRVDYANSGACTGMGGQIGGFYPPVLKEYTDEYATPPDYPDYYKPAYDQMGGRELSGSGNSNVMVPAANRWCYDRGWYGDGIGDLSNAKTPADINAVMTTACTRMFSSGELTTSGDPVTFTANYDNPKNVTGLLCFESAPGTTFIYEPGQEFFFRGDDDIWVYINNRLVLDLGGNHMPAPGYIKLDTIGYNDPKEKLVPGEAYPINIFFCDRRAPGSNVRIATNMYFAQKSLLSKKGQTDGSAGAQVCIESSGTTGTCASIIKGESMGSKGCGTELGNILDYYVTNRKGDTLDLSAANTLSCLKDGDDLRCYTGIILKNYFAAPMGSVSNIVTTGEYNGLMGQNKIYARIKPDLEKDYPGAEHLFIALLTAGASNYTVWGPIYDFNSKPGDKPLYDLGPKHKETVAGKRVPIGFSVGEWRCGEEARRGEKDCEFEVAMVSANEGGALGATVYNIPAPQAAPGGTFADLKWYESENATEDINRPTQGQIPANTSQGPIPGLLIYWVEGDLKASDDQEHSIGPDLKVKVWLPRMAFVDPATATLGTPTRLTTSAPNGIYQTKGSDPSAPGANGSARAMSVMIGETMPRAVAAYDISYSANNPANWKVCESCDFTLSSNAWITEGTTTASVPSLQIMSLTPTPPKLTNGVATFSAIGSYPVQQDSFAFLTIRGPSTSKEETFAKWDSLQFEKPDVPYPVNAEIYDMDGDGFGDSLRIAYDRAFPCPPYSIPYEPQNVTRPCPGGLLDSLPSMVEVFWDPDSVFRFGLGTPGVVPDSWTSSKDRDADYAFWNGGGVAGFKTKIEHDSVLVIYGDSLSLEIKTWAPSDQAATITSWATFVNTKKGQTDPADFGLKTPINDRIPAIVVKAIYEADKNRCGSGPTSTCKDQVRITVSEPVKIAEAGLSNEVKYSPFAYKLVSRGSNNFVRYNEDKDLAKQIRPDMDKVPDASVFTMSYERYRAADTTNTPMGGDSVRFVWADAGAVTYVDLVGNLPNPREMGRRLEGANPFIVDEIRITNLDPDKDVLKDAVNDILGPDVSYDDLYGKDKQVAFIPAEDSWTADSIKIKFPGSVGQFFSPDVANTVSKMEDELGVKIKPEDITFHAKSFYHTNLGNYVAQSKELVISCTDKIFTAFGDENCMSKTGTPKGIYLAWNLKDAKNRWVGAGAYVEVYDFYWQIQYDPGNGKKTKVIDSVEKRVEMLGVRRAKKK